MLERQPCPEGEAPVRSPAALLLPPPAGDRAADAASVGTGGRIERFQPTRERNAKTFFAPGKRCLRQKTGHRLAQYIFPLPTPEFEAVRQSLAEIDKVIVKEDCSSLSDTIMAARSTLARMLSCR